MNKIITLFKNLTHKIIYLKELIKAHYLNKKYKGAFDEVIAYMEYHKCTIEEAENDIEKIHEEWTNSYVFNRCNK